MSVYCFASGYPAIIDISTQCISAYVHHCEDFENILELHEQASGLSGLQISVL